MYLLAAEKAVIAAGQIFDAANDFTESTDDFLQKLVQVSGAKEPFEYLEPKTRECFPVLCDVCATYSPQLTLFEQYTRRP